MKVQSLGWGRDWEGAEVLILTPGEGGGKLNVHIHTLIDSKNNRLVRVFERFSMFGEWGVLFCPVPQWAVWNVSSSSSLSSQNVYITPPPPCLTNSYNEIKITQFGL